MRMLSDEQDDRRQTFDVIVSVPHSGTRSLVKHLDLPSPPRSGAGRWWHFGMHDSLLRAFRVRAHVPVRRPIDVARAWARREKTGDPINAMLKAYSSMFDYLSDHDDAILYRIEGLQYCEGSHEAPDGPRDGDLVRQFEDAVREYVIEPYGEFFKTYYKDM